MKSFHFSFTSRFKWRSFYFTLPADLNYVILFYFISRFKWGHFILPLPADLNDVILFYFTSRFKWRHFILPLQGRVASNAPWEYLRNPLKKICLLLSLMKAMVQRTAYTCVIHSSKWTDNCSLQLVYIILFVHSLNAFAIYLQ